MVLTICVTNFVISFDAISELKAKTKAEQNIRPLDKIVEIRFNQFSIALYQNVSIERYLLNFKMYR